MYRLRKGRDSYLEGHPRNDAGATSNRRQDVEDEAYNWPLVEHSAGHGEKQYCKRGDERRVQFAPDAKACV